ncbi:hypothetical protein [Bacillus sp. AK031]
MGFTVFFFLTWLVISIFAVVSSMKKIVENTFTYFITLTLSINFSWIIIDEMNLISLTEKGMPYTAYLLNRSIIIPLTVLIYVLFILKSDSWSKKIMISIISVITLVAISFASTSLDILTYKRWNLGFDALYYLLLIFASALSYKLISKITRNVVSES